MMKIKQGNNGRETMDVMDNRLNSLDKKENQAQTDTFVSGLTPELLSAICRGMDVSSCPAAVVSDDLMVLRQTDSCGKLLEPGIFYPIDGLLPPETCRSIRTAIETGEEHITSVLLQDERWSVHISPTADQAVLVFRRVSVHQAGQSMGEAQLRMAASGLLQCLREDTLDRENLRRRTLQVLRIAEHMGTLFGAPEMPVRQLCSTAELLRQIQNDVSDMGVTVSLPQDDGVVYADRHRLLSALLTLIANSLCHNGEDIHILVGVRQDEDIAVFCIDDDGIGMQEQAFEALDHWRVPDAVPGFWGLGVPYAKAIAEQHGNGFRIQIGRAHV